MKEPDYLMGLYDKKASKDEYLQDLFKIPHGSASVGGVSVKFNQLQDLMKMPHGHVNAGGMSVKFNNLQDLFTVKHLQNMNLIETAMGAVPY